MKNVRILNAMVGRFLGGQVVESSAFEGGDAEIQRLADLHAVAWVEDPVNVAAPASATAVAEMTDDELVVENKKLKELHDAKDTKVAELEAELAKLKAATTPPAVGTAETLAEQAEAPKPKPKK